jgi:hypothetical protein
MNPPLVTRLMMVALRKAAMALAAVIAMEPPKYMYVDLILSFTYWGHKTDRSKVPTSLDIPRP